MSTALTLAPVCPHIAEEVYLHMGGGLDSVHMEDWPSWDEGLIRDDLEYSMKLIQDIVEIIAAERQKMGSKLRWPLKSVTICGDETTVDSVGVFGAVLAQQGNIKSVEYTGEAPGKKGLVAVSFGPGDVFVDFEVTPEIESEGYARELIRRIQQMRKDMKLDVEDYINCEIKAEEDLERSVSTWKEHISGEVRSKKLIFTDNPGGESVKAWDVSGKEIVIGISISV
ncbi:Isoleucine--tRNA ligase [bioreactor metagenome]|uniref:Isoleucine--tRNA ligase n=1 Tax=bioreactor metagenome TaxID=1076179 RepID=A0A645EW11_9ZZZZ